MTSATPRTGPIRLRITYTLPDFENPGEFGDAIPFIERTRYASDDSNSQDQFAGLAPVQLTPDGQTDLVMLDSSGQLTSWFNVTGAKQVTPSDSQTPSGGHNLGVHIPGSDAVFFQATGLTTAGRTFWFATRRPGTCSFGS